jgi:hypothetical protein
MRHLTLSCPVCGRWLEHIPLDGLTLYYRCAEHGELTFRPLVLLAFGEQVHSRVSSEGQHDAA